MAGNRKNNDGKKPGWLIFVWFLFAAMVMAPQLVVPFIPVGVIVGMVFFFKTVLGRKESTSSPDNRQAVRMDKYLIITEGRDVESIPYLASALGVSYETALKDLQKMVSEGRFGPDAYINYVDRTVVIRPAAKRPEPQVKNRPSGGAQGSNMVSRAAESDAKKKADIPKGTADAPVKPDGKLRTWLLIAGIVLIGIGILRLAISGESVFGLVSGVIAAMGGVGVIGFGGYLKKRENRFKLYRAACEGRDCVPVEELARKAGISQRKCRRDLEAMIDKGLLTKTAYIDQGDGVLVLKPGAAPKAETSPTPPADDEDRYKSILRQIRKLNDEIPDEGVSRRIDEMEDLTGRIFKAVQEKPEKEPQIKSFMSYYLPTTLKLLRSYADFEKSGADGDNIRSTKAEIERILDTLVDGFKKQLDKLYESEAMDISSDIDVLENMLRRDGLTGDGSAFQAQASQAAQAKEKKE